jgi:hypothetical protein
MVVAVGRVLLLLLLLLLGVAAVGVYVVVGVVSTALLELP